MQQHCTLGMPTLAWVRQKYVNGICCAHQVFFNGARLPIKGFQDYVALYLKDPAAPRVYERVNERWEVCVCASEGQFQQARLPVISPGCDMTTRASVFACMECAKTMLCCSAHACTSKISPINALASGYFGLLENWGQDIAGSVPKLLVHAQVSFVNSVCTIKGGTHVNHVVDQITKCASLPPFRLFSALRAARKSRAKHKELLWDCACSPACVTQAQCARGSQGHLRQDEQGQEGGGGEALHGEELPLSLHQLHDREPRLRLPGAALALLSLRTHLPVPLLLPLVLCANPYWSVLFNQSR